MGRRGTIWNLWTGNLRRISARISPRGPAPSISTFVFTMLESINANMSIFANFLKMDCPRRGGFGAPWAPWGPPWGPWGPIGGQHPGMPGCLGPICLSNILAYPAVCIVIYLTLWYDDPYHIGLDPESSEKRLPGGSGMSLLRDDKDFQSCDSATQTLSGPYQADIQSL